MESKSETVDFNKNSEEYINLLYQGTSGFISYYPGEREEAEKSKVYFTYGEILYPSLNKIIQYMDIDENDVFYDFGSGVGKVVLQVLLNTPVKKAIGIEFNKKRNDVAVKVYKQVKHEFPELIKNREFECLNKNFLEVDVSDATIIYACSTLFAPPLLADIAKVIDQHCPKLKYLISIPSVKYDYTHIPCESVKVEDIMDIDCTWDKTVCYIYTPKGTGEMLPYKKPH
jgi:hypothetical protein